MVLFDTTEITCLPLNLTNAIISTDDVVYQTPVNITCQPGYKFSSNISLNQSWVVVQCQATKTWSPQPANCKGWLNHVQCVHVCNTSYHE